MFTHFLYFVSDSLAALKCGVFYRLVRPSRPKKRQKRRLQTATSNDSFGNSFEVMQI